MAGTLIWRANTYEGEVNWRYVAVHNYNTVNWNDSGLGHFFFGKNTHTHRLYKINWAKACGIIKKHDFCTGIQSRLHRH